MTDRSTQPGRIDLRAIDEPADPLQAERVVGAAMARMAARGPAHSDVFASIGAYSRLMLAAAAVLCAIATSTVILTSRRAAAQPLALLASWAESQHVPTNGELLVTFQGYGR